MEEKTTAASSRVTGVNPVRKADTNMLITEGAGGFPEDSFTGQYWTGGTVADGVAVLEPNYKPGVLAALAAQNNTLMQCIEAMEVNIDGTGYSIELAEEGGEENEAERQIMEDFFKEPSFGKSMSEIRRAIRRDYETTGNGYMEVLRALDDSIVTINHLDAHTTRLLRYDSPVEVQRPLRRGGQTLTVRTSVRERRFVQIINGSKVYFKEFGASRDLDRETGRWATVGTRLPIQKRASEVIHFCGSKEPKTSYGSPRWINQLPSVLGSRKAEEHNLEFFDGGGIPPVLVLIEGGSIGDTVRGELRQHLSGSGNKHRAAIVEAVSNSGTLDSAGSVRVRVERFGSERQNDAMFQSYDKECAEHVRTAFRLPPIFLGRSSEYNFATAYTAYMVAEAQVFYPERDAFDDRLNNTIVRGFGVERYRYRSLPLSLTDVANQLAAIELAVTNKIISAEEAVSKLNEVTGLSMESDDSGTGLPPAPAPATGTGSEVPQPLGVTKSEVDIAALAADWVNSSGLRGAAYSDLYSEEQRASVLKSVQSLGAKDQGAFHAQVASMIMTTPSLGIADLCGCASHLVEG